MQNKLFFFHGEQPAGGGNCQNGAYVCENNADIATLQNKLIGVLVGLARATEGNESLVTESTDSIVIQGLCAGVNGESFTRETVCALIEQTEKEKARLVPDCYYCAAPCGRTSNYDVNKLWLANEDVRSLKTLILLGIRSIAAYAHRASVLGHHDATVNKFFYKALFAIGMDDWGVDELRCIATEMVDVNAKCMALLNKALG